MKLRGAYVLIITPGYAWFDQALIGSSQWASSTRSRWGAVRYIDRDNYNGLYFKVRWAWPALLDLPMFRRRTTCAGQLRPGLHLPQQRLHAVQRRRLHRAG